MNDRDNRHDGGQDSLVREQHDPEDINIQDFSETPDYDKLAGLSDEQVSNIAADLLNSIEYTRQDGNSFGRMHGAS